MTIKAFECALKNDEEIKISKRLMLSAGGYMRAVDEVLKRYPANNVLIEKYTKPSGAEMKPRTHGNKVRVDIEALKERKVYGENRIFIRNDKTLWRVKNLGKRIMIDPKQPVKEYCSVKGRPGLVLHVYDNIGKSWIAKI